MSTEFLLLLVVCISYISYLVYLNNQVINILNLKHTVIDKLLENEKNPNIKKSFLNYEKTRDFTLLKKRIIFLTHNYIMNKKLTKGQIKAGIYFSYPYANPEENGSLYNLDKFLQICIYNLTLSKNQKKEVCKRTFTHGVENKTILTYKYVEFMKITTIWKNG